MIKQGTLVPWLLRFCIHSSEPEEPVFLSPGEGVQTEITGFDQMGVIQQPKWEH